MGQIMFNVEFDDKELADFVEHRGALSRRQRRDLEVPEADTRKDAFLLHYYILAQDRPIRLYVGLFAFSTMLVHVTVKAILGYFVQ